MALEWLPLFTSQQSTHLKNWTEISGTRARACLLLPISADDCPGYTSYEIRTLKLMESIIRKYAGESFTPTAIWLASQQKDIYFDIEGAYPNIPVFTSKPYGAVEFSTQLLSAENPNHSKRLADFSDQLNEPNLQNISDILRLVLPAYLPDHRLRVSLGADITYHSARTLQRKLKQEKTSFRRIVDDVRCRAALQYLGATNMPISEIADKLGYSEEAAFIRAFKRWTAHTPGDYRCLTSF